MPAAIFGNVADPGLDGIRRRGDVNGRTVDDDLAGIERRQAKQRFRQLRATRADESRQPEDLPALDGEGHVADAGSAIRHTAHVERDRSDRDRPLREDGRQLAANHHADQIGTRDVARGARGNRLPVPEHGDAIGNREDFFEPMRNVDDAGAGLAEDVDHSEQALDLAIGERGGRLVHDHDLGVDADRLGDLHELLLGHAQRFDETLRVDRGSDALPGARRPDDRVLFQSIGRHAPPRSSERAMFSATVRSGNNAGCW